MSTVPLPPNDGVPTEPTQMTLGDLVALIAGAGLAVVSGWNVLTTGPGTLIPRALPGWFVVLFYAKQVFEKACEALVPVILVRKIRHATPVRPGEFAALGWGLIVVPATVFNGVPERIAIGAVLLIGGASIFVLARRCRLPGWARGLLVFAAWFAAAAIVSVAYAAAIDALLGDHSAPSSSARAALDWALKTDPNRVLTHAPTAFAVLDLLGRRGRRRTWVEWAGSPRPSGCGSRPTSKCSAASGSASSGRGPRRWMRSSWPPRSPSSR